MFFSMGQSTQRIKLKVIYNYERQTVKRTEYKDPRFLTSFNAISSILYFNPDLIL